MISSRPGKGCQRPSRAAGREPRRAKRRRACLPTREDGAAQLDIHARPIRRLHDEEDPAEAQQDHRHAHEQRIEEELARRNVAEGVDDDGSSIHEDEEKRVEEVLRDLPDRDSLQSHLVQSSTPAYASPGRPRP